MKTNKLVGKNMSKAQVFKIIFSWVRLDFTFIFRTGFDSGRREVRAGLAPSLALAIY